VRNTNEYMKDHIHCDDKCNLHIFTAVHFDNFMTKLIVPDNRTNARKTDVYLSSFFKYNIKKVSSSHKLLIHESVCLLIMKISQWTRENLAVVVKLIKVSCVIFLQPNCAVSASEKRYLCELERITTSFDDVHRVIWISFGQ